MTFALFPPQLLDVRQPRPAFALEGYTRDDRVEVMTPRQPGCWRKGRVIAACPRLHRIYIILDGSEGVVDVNPTLHPHVVRHQWQATP